VSTGNWDYLVALAGNPNTGKSTVFNALTGLRQHTGNWPGKTVARAEGTFGLKDNRVKVIDLPGTYSLQAGSTDEEVARDFILFGEPDVTVVVVDATRLERNLNLVLQILEITDRVVVCLNLMDEARRHGIAVDAAKLSRELGVPVVPAAARRGEGIPELLEAIDDVAANRIVTAPYRIKSYHPDVEAATSELMESIEAAFPNLPNARWVAMRLLNADTRVIEAIESGDLGEVEKATGTMGRSSGAIAMSASPEQVLHAASALRWRLPANFHDALTESMYKAAQDITSRVAMTGLRRSKFDFDRTLDRLLTSRLLGFPLMVAILTVVFWLTIA
jgi:ferrous iron transport protein B